MLIGVLWNMHVVSTYSWFMISRIMQAVGWGASEALVTISIRDMFFVSPSISSVQDLANIA